ncbi:MAG: hypothetical protein CVU05_15945 [Bacteroidetes bacterium HGW-Bacteroidetes-21]|jgi:hypothetical protein|nr:MAG: hypothetical protein CVU05_15945 [Bacteroidetes bacterium HGW-Bacteroidetes-21]
MKTLKTILLILLPNFIFAQVNLYNVNLVDSNINILYIGKYNKIMISGIKDNINLTISASNCNVDQDSSSSIFFYLIPKKQGNDTIKVYNNDSLILKKIYLNKIFPPPIVILGNIKDTVATVNEIISNTKLVVTQPDCFWKPFYFVSRCDITFYRHSIKGKKNYSEIKNDYKIIHKKFNKTTEEITVCQLVDTFYVEDKKNNELILKVEKGGDEYCGLSSGILNEMHIKIIKTLKKGDEIWIENISVGCPECTYLALPPIHIKIK